MVLREGGYAIWDGEPMPYVEAVSETLRGRISRPGARAQQGSLHEFEGFRYPCRYPSQVGRTEYRRPMPFSG